MMGSKWLLVATVALSPLLAADKINYIALGESVAYGFSPLLLGSSGSAFIGYPEVLASKPGKGPKRLENTACPGETSGSFLSATVRDNQCRDFKAAFGLKSYYGGVQMEAALDLLKSNPNVDLITLTIGGNDLLLLQADCKFESNCIFAGLPPVLEQYGKNLATILAGLRDKYKGTIVMVTYYSPNYQDPVQTTGIAALNSVAVEVAGALGVKVADGFRAFLLASSLAGGNTCNAGLLVKLPNGTCDVHPSAKGQGVLAATVALTLAFN